MRKTLILATMGALACAGAVLAQDAPFGMEIKARQGIMAYRAVNIGVLAAMAKGEAEYNAEAAKVAADALLSTTKIDASMIWPAGSDNSVNPASTASPAIWAEGSTIGESAAAFSAAAEGMAAAAGTDLASLQAAIEPLGAACGGCHKAFRVPAN